MKYLILIAVIASFNAQATEKNNNNGTTATANAVANAGAVGLGGVGIGGSVGNTTLNNTTQASDMGDLRIVPPAIAPSINTNVICPMVSQGSKAVSLWPISLSGTHAPDIVPICVAWHLGQKDVVEKMTCAISKEYAKANPVCAK